MAVNQFHSALAGMKLQGWAISRNEDVFLDLGRNLAGE